MGSGYIKSRLGLLYFLQFGIWGCYLTCLGQFLGSIGLGRDIAWFYAAVGFVSLLLPAAVGHIADRYISPTRLLGICHIGGAISMWLLWIYCTGHDTPDFWPVFLRYLLFLCCFLPTLALANTVTFGLLKRHGVRPVDVFGRIRIWGTVGFVAAMWFVNSAYWHDGIFGFTLDESSPLSVHRFQYTSMQLLSAAVMAIITAIYTFTLPSVPIARNGGRGWRAVLGLQGIGLLRQSHVKVFLALAVLSGVCLQITNGFATPFISHFRGMAEYAGSGAAGNSTMLFSLSQISEAACVLIVGTCMNRWGIKAVLVTALAAWSLRFGFFAAGNPGDGLWMLIASMLVYGIAFNFFTIAAHLYMDQITDSRHRGLGQGLLMLMSNGVGASLGTLAAGGVVNHYCHWTMVPAGNGMERLFMGDWSMPWSIFALYAGTVALLYLFFFRPHTTTLPAPGKTKKIR